MSEWRVSGIRWLLANDAARVPDAFTMLELFRLGGGTPAPGWGAAGDALTGCYCLRVPGATAWEESTGRAPTGQLGGQLADVMLRTAEALSARRLPAALIKDVAAFAMQDVIDTAGPAYFDDWLPVAFAARDLRDDRFDDYVAALTASGPLVPVRKNGPEATTERAGSRPSARSSAGRASACRRPSCAPRPQAPPSIRITSPADGTYLMGAVRFTLAFEPAGLVNQVQHVRWFADGNLVCTSSVPPYSCEWDAGAMVNEHLVRAVATLRNGERLVANARTAAVEYAEAVDVDVIQITAVVTDGGTLRHRPEGGGLQGL